jgi:predicted Zn-dependent peptidase
MDGWDCEPLSIRCCFDLEGARLSATVCHTQLANGLTVVIESMASVRSASINLLVPSGGASDPPDAVGCATVLGEMTLRGAGARSSRQLSEAMDDLGVQRGMNTRLYFTRYSAACVGANLPPLLPILADVVGSPVLGEDAFEPARELAVQALDGLADDPRARVTTLLMEKHWPEPFGRNPMGRLDHLEHLTLGACRDSHRRRYTPGGSILAIAGDVDAPSILAFIRAAFDAWQGEVPKPSAPERTLPGSHHDDSDSEQTHIALALPAVTERDEGYYACRVMTELLGGASSSRLFTELREKRGLCYAVGLGYTPLIGAASLLGYVGTTADRAQQTLDHYLAEVKRLPGTVTDEEVARAKVGMISQLVMSNESTGSRAGAIANDVMVFGRVRPVGEILAGVDAVDARAVNDVASRLADAPRTLAVVGPEPLSIPE